MFSVRSCGYIATAPFFSSLSECVVMKYIPARAADDRRSQTQGANAKDKMRNARDGVVKQTHSGVEQGKGEEPGNTLHGMQDISGHLSIPVRKAN